MCQGLYSVLDALEPFPHKLLTLLSQGRIVGQSAAEVSLSAGFQIPENFSATCQQTCQQLSWRLPAAAESMQLHVTAASGASCSRMCVAEFHLSSAFAEIFPALCKLPSSMWRSTAKFVGGCDRTLRISCSVCRVSKNQEAARESSMRCVMCQALAQRGISISFADCRLSESCVLLSLEELERHTICDRRFLMLSKHSPYPP